MGEAFDDHFSAISDDYAAYRPHYPAALFEWLASVANGRELAWDCATGSGQAAAALAPHFTRVIASDAAAAQVQAAPTIPGVRFEVFPAEQTPLGDHSANVVTIAQALHWFDHDRFYAEVKRVLEPGGLIAAWTYQLFTCDPAVDAVIDTFYRGPIDRFWPPERRLVEARYETIPFPFEPVEAPTFEMTAEWRLDHVFGYLGTWSAVKRYREANGHDPREALREPLSEAWGDPKRGRRIVWSMPLLVGRSAAR